MKAGGISPRKAGLSTAVTALIVVVIGIALALVMASIAGGFLFGYGTAPRVTIEKADILVDPAGTNAYIAVDVRNSGGAALYSCNVEVVEIALDWDQTDVDLNPGQIATFTATYTEAGGPAGSFYSGEVYVFRVTCTAPGGIEVSDQKSAIAHL